VYYEEFGYVWDAIRREKQLKKYRRDWKKNLINSMNPGWQDLSAGWYDSREFENFIR
jgi:putative endonuclease